MGHVLGARGAAGGRDEQGQHEGRDDPEHGFHFRRSGAPHTNPAPGGPGKAFRRMTDVRPTESEITDDALLGGRVRLVQPARGYRAAIDPVLLAAAVAARPGDRVLDAGAGAGAASLCLAARVAQCRIVGVERDLALLALFERNIAANGFGDRVSAMAGDIAEPLPELAPGAFDRVMINPPYMPAQAADPPPDAGRAAAMVEDTTDLAAWLDFGLAMLRRKGTLTVIHRADRLDALMSRPSWPGRRHRRAAALAQGRAGGAARHRGGAQGRGRPGAPPARPRAPRAGRRLYRRRRGGAARRRRARPGRLTRPPGSRGHCSECPGPLCWGYFPGKSGSYS